MRPAAPQCISGRTSYLRVRLAFHPYPQLIRNFCNRYRFGPSRPITGAAAWPWVAHTVSGLPPATNALFTLGFPRAPAVAALTGPLMVTRRVILQKARDHRGAKGTLRLSLHGCGRFQALFHSPRRGAFHRSLTVLVPYRSPAVFSLGPWSTRIPTRFRVSDGTHVHVPPRPVPRHLRDSHPLRSAVPVPFG